MSAASADSSPAAVPAPAAKTTIVPYTPVHIPEVRAFNARLREHDVPYKFPEDSVPEWLPPGDDPSLYHAYFVACEGENVRGGYIFKHQEFVVAGESQPVGFFRLPLSEGAYDKRYGALAAQFLLHALKKNPLLFSLGIGGYEEPLAKMQAAVGWTQWSVPFLFRIERPFSFLRNIAHLRRHPLRRLLLDGLAFSGLGYLGFHAFRLLKQIRNRAPSPSFAAIDVPSFGSWADAIWAVAKGEYSFIAVRTEATLNRLFPTDDPRYLRVQVLDGSRTVGWAVAMSTQHQNHKHFGSMRLGALVDFLAVPGYEAHVVAAATRRLQSTGVDLIIVNVAHTAWTTALRDAGYFEGPSNFIFSASKKLAERLRPFDRECRRLHLTRGDGDGPIHL